MSSENGCNGENNENDENDENDNVGFASPCEQLSLARQARGQTVEDIATALKIPESYVRALEQGDFNVLPGKAFIRGYLKNYARQVGIDGNLLLKALALDVNMGVATDPIPEIAAQPMLERRSSSVIRYTVSFVSVVVVVAVSYYWWNKTHQEEKAPVAVEQQNSPAELAKPASDSSLSASEKPLGEAGSSAYQDTLLSKELSSDSDLKPMTLAPAILLSNTAEKVQAEAEKVQTEKAVVTPALGTADLYIRFTADCWIEVQDMGGNVLATGVKKAGAVLDISVPSEVSLRLGNVPGVEAISFGGRKVDIPSGIADQKVASLTLTSTT